MRLSAYLSNTEVFLAALCGLLLAPAVWVVLVILTIIVEAAG